MTMPSYLADVDVVDPTAQTALEFSAPSVQWMNGKRALQKAGGLSFTGGFFFSYEQCEEGTTIPKWEQDSRVVGNGKEIQGIGAHVAGVTFIRFRRRWVIETDNHREFRAWNNYEPGMRGHMQVIGFIKGYPNPVCFTFRGTAIRDVTNIMQEHARKVCAFVNKSIPQGKPKLPTFAFWTGVRAGPHAMVGQGEQSEVTAPTIAIPKEITSEYCQSIYVGRENLLASQQLFHELDSWSAAWNFDAAPTAQQHAPAPPSARQMPSIPMGEYPGEAEESPPPARYGQRPATNQASTADDFEPEIKEDDIPF